jgi:hypothetical protein
MMVEKKELIPDPKTGFLSIKEGDYEENETVVDPKIIDLKHQMDKSDQEMKTMTEAIKSTLLDVKNMMQDMDDPFDILHDMGVDKIMDTSVERLKEGVMRQKPSKHVSYNDSLEKTRKTKSTQSKRQLVQEKNAPIIENLQQGHDNYPSLISHDKNKQEMDSPIKRYENTEETVSMLLKRVSRTEKNIENLNEALKELVYTIKETKNQTSNYETSNNPKNLYSNYQTLELKKEKPEEVYYHAYVSLISEYLLIRFGEKGAEEILLEGMYKGWASPRVIRDIMDYTSANTKAIEHLNITLPLGLGNLSSDLEDKILLTSLLNNLDKPATKWKEPTHLLLLLALVTRARESMLSKES